MTITPLTLTLPFALGAYLFVAHTLGAPGYAPIAAFLAGGVTALVGMFCVGLVEDTLVIPFFVKQLWAIADVLLALIHCICVIALIATLV